MNNLQLGSVTALWSVVCWPLWSGCAGCEEALDSENLWPLCQAVMPWAPSQLPKSALAPSTTAGNWAWEMVGAKHVMPELNAAVGAWDSCPGGKSNLPTEHNLPKLDDYWMRLLVFKVVMWLHLLDHAHIPVKVLCDLLTSYWEVL